jgi:hypothetical protein
MPRKTSKDIEQDKLARFDRIKNAITALDKQLATNIKTGGAGSIRRLGSALSSSAFIIRNIGTTNYKCQVHTSHVRHHQS